MKNKKDFITKDSTKGRIRELDLIRGFCVFLMIFDHTMYDLGFVFAHQWFFAETATGFIYNLCSFAHDVYWMHPLRIGIRVLVLVCFIGICGICCSFSRSNMLRGLKLLGVAMLVTVATAALDMINGVTNSAIIRFGILHLLAVSILVYGCLQKFPRALLLGIGVVLMVLGWYFTVYPSSWQGLLPYIMGVGDGSYSADYFPVLPWVGYFLAGAAVGTWLYRDKRSFFPTMRNTAAHRAIEFTGRHALWFYVLHQPLIYGALLIFGKLLFNA